MKALLASVAAMALVANSALAAPTAKTTKTHNYQGRPGQGDDEGHDHRHADLDKARSMRG